MEQFIYSLGEFTRRDFVEFQIGPKAQEKFQLPSSLYVRLPAFHFFLEPLFRSVVPEFSLTSTTVVTKAQWKQVLRQDMTRYEKRRDFPALKHALDEIDWWMEVHIPDDGCFTVLGL